MNGKQLTANIAYVRLEAPQSAAAALTSDFFSMKNVDRVAIVIDVGAVTSGNDSFYAYLKEATAVAGTSAQVLTIPRAYKYTDSVDLATAVTVENDGSIELEANTTYVIDVLASELTVNSDFDCLGLLISDPGAQTPAILSANAICYNLRQYSTVLTD